MHQGKELHSKASTAMKWSFATQIMSKLSLPVTNMFLARLLSPEAFGLVVAITMITSFVEMISDAGFQKYLVQHQFESEKTRDVTANVAFWTNILLSISFWLAIILLRDKIALFIGSPDNGLAIAIACMQLPLTAFSSIQQALFWREFDAKSMFIVKIFVLAVPFITSIPMAYFGFDFWSIIVGNIAMQACNAIVLWTRSTWKPKVSYRFSVLRAMFRYSAWSLAEAFSIWMTAWIDSFIIGHLLSTYYLGLYRTSTVMVNSLMALITASVAPVLFSLLSRLQNDPEQFRSVFFTIQRRVGYVVILLGILTYVFSDLATSIVLGGKWSEASSIIGIWALTSAIMIACGILYSEAYRAVGMPRLSFFVQFAHIIFLVPTCLVSIQFGFFVLVYSRALIRIQSAIVHVIIMHWKMGISAVLQLQNLIPHVFSGGLVLVVASVMLPIGKNIGLDFGLILWCTIFYIAILCAFKTTRTDFKSLLAKLNKGYK